MAEQGRHAPARCGVALLALTLAAIGSCELPKPPVPQLPGGQVHAAPQLVASRPVDSGRGTPGWPIAAVLTAVPR